MPLGPIIFKLELFEKESDRQRSQTVLLWFLEVLVKTNMLWLRDNPRKVPPLYQADVHYEFNPAYPDAWKDIPTIVADKQGDCEDLACWRAAELKMAGIAGVRPYLKWRKKDGDGWIYHVLVRWPDGRIEDPSVALGMLGPMPSQPVFLKERDVSTVAGDWRRLQSSPRRLAP